MEICICGRNRWAKAISTTISFQAGGKEKAIWSSRFPSTAIYSPDRRSATLRNNFCTLRAMRWLVQGSSEIQMKAR